MTNNARKVFVNRQIDVDSPMPENIGGVHGKFINTTDIRKVLEEAQ